MSRKQKTTTSKIMMFSYVETDHDFDEFLKMLLHDFLFAEAPCIVSKKNVVDNIEFGVALTIPVAIPNLVYYGVL